jgi:hypothetical protein
MLFLQPRARRTDLGVLYNCFTGFSHGAIRQAR